MSNLTSYPVPPELADNAHIQADDYSYMYERSLTDPDAFWGETASRLSWIKPFTKVKNASFDSDVSIKWFEDGTLNLCANALDRHLPARTHQIAYIFEGDEPGSTQKITFGEMKEKTCQIANTLLDHGVKKGDVVTIYMPMIPQAIMSMLACARIGAIHSVVFGGFSADALRDRIVNANSDFIITADEGVRGGKRTPLKANVDNAVEGLDIRHVLVYPRTGASLPMQKDRDLDWKKTVATQKTCAPIAEMNAEDPLFILYTSGSTGKPKGVMHTTAGYALYASLTHQWVFDVHEEDVYWCTADIGWVTGHSYVVYGPLINGCTSVIYEGVPQYPTWGRTWRIVQDHGVSIFYTAPTAIRSMLQAGNEWVKTFSKKSLRVLGTVGEPINEEAWHWYRDVVGESRCPVIDTWWQTETGGHMITALPGATELIPGWATKPFFGVDPVLIDPETQQEIKGEGAGHLCMRTPWPGMMRSVYGDHQRFKDTYFATYKNLYFTGDGAMRDKDGNYRITGRVDDVLNVSGHRLGTAELESAINLHKSVAESAVVGMPHDIKGEGIYAYVILKANETPSEAIKKEIISEVRKHIGPIATLDMVHFTDALPKTRSGKIMRRILRKIAAGEFDALGDTSTLADPACVEQLISGRQQLVAA